MKTCTKCKQTLPLTSFRKDRTKRDGLCSWCTSCAVAANRKKRAAHPEVYRATLRDWRQRNPDYNLIYYSEHKSYWEDRRRANPEERRTYRRTRRARERGAYVELVVEAFIIERDAGLCGICKEPVDFAQVAPHPRSPSLDHIIPLARGGTHEPAYVQLAHLGCNKRKATKPGLSKL